MTKFNQGDAVIAKLPNDFYSTPVDLFVVAQTDGLVTCLYFDVTKPVSVVIPADWLSLREPVGETVPFTNLE